MPLKSRKGASSSISKSGFEAAIVLAVSLVIWTTLVPTAVVLTSRAFSGAVKASARGWNAAAVKPAAHATGAPKARANEAAAAPESELDREATIYRFIVSPLAKPIKTG